MPENHVFVDYDNVKIPSSAPALIRQKRLTVTVLVGPQKTKLDTDLVSRLLDSPATVKLIRLEKLGRNAVDFSLAYYAGQTSATHPDAYLHIISGDVDYDPLICHLQSKGVRLTRHLSFSDFEAYICPPSVANSSPSKRPIPPPAEKIAPVKKAAKKATSAKKATAKKVPAVDYYQRTLNHLRQTAREKRPQTEAALLAALKNLHKGKVEETRVAGLLVKLKNRGVVILGEESKLLYKLA